MAFPMFLYVFSYIMSLFCKSESGASLFALRDNAPPALPFLYTSSNPNSTVDSASATDMANYDDS